MVSPLRALSRAVIVSTFALVGLSAAAVLVPSDATASVSIAVAFDMLVKDADAVALVTAGDPSSVWEDGRIYTYTKVKVDQGIAGDVGPGTEGWVRTMGGVVGKIGQLVDGEPVLVKDKPSLLFLRKLKAGGVYEVSARAQGQYPVSVDEATKLRKILRSSAVGMLLPPKAAGEAAARTSTSSSTSPQSVAPAAASVPPETLKVRLAQEVLHDRAIDDVTREIATAWNRLHKTTAPAAAPAK